MKTRGVRRSFGTRGPAIMSRAFDKCLCVCHGGPDWLLRVVAAKPRTARSHRPRGPWPREAERRTWPRPASGRRVVAGERLLLGEELLDHRLGQVDRVIGPADHALLVDQDGLGDAGRLVGVRR